MKKLKQILILFLLTTLIISCSSSSSSEDNSTPTLTGKWAFGPDTGCGGRNSIEFKNTNVFIEHHYNGNCSLSNYNGVYSRTGDIVTINGTEKVIVELTTTSLTLYTPSNENTKTYDRVN